MKLLGDNDGINALKEMKEQKPDFLKFLLNEMRTNTDYTAFFKSADGSKKFKAVYDPKTGEINIQVQQ